MWQLLVNVTLILSILCILYLIFWLFLATEGMQQPFPITQLSVTTFGQSLFSVSPYWHISPQIEGHWLPLPVRLLNVTFWLVWQNPLGQTVSHYPKSIVIDPSCLPHEQIYPMSSCFLGQFSRRALRLTLEDKAESLRSVVFTVHAEVLKSINLPT